MLFCWTLLWGLREGNDSSQKLMLSEHREALKEMLSQVWRFPLCTILPLPSPNIWNFLFPSNAEWKETEITEVAIEQDCQPPQSPLPTQVSTPLQGFSSAVQTPVCSWGDI